jgi:hypothetical protein
LDQDQLLTIKENTMQKKNLSAGEHSKLENAEKMTAAVTKMAEAFTKQHEAPTNMPLFPFHQAPPFTALILVDKITYATITDVPSLGPVLEMFTGFCAKHTDARTITLELIRQT